MAERPTYKSKNNKAIKQRLTDILNSKVYKGYDAASDSMYKDFTAGNLQRSKQAAAETVANANRNLGRNTYANAAAQGMRTLYDSKNNEIVPALADIDYKKQVASRENKFAGANTLLKNEQTAYSRYRDKVKDWEFNRNADLKEAYLNKKASGSGKGGGGGKKAATTAPGKATGKASKGGSGSGGGEAMSAPEVQNQNLVPYEILNNNVYYPGENQATNNNQALNTDQKKDLMNAIANASPYQQQEWKQNAGALTQQQESISDQLYNRYFSKDVKEEDDLRGSKSYAMANGVEKVRGEITTRSKAEKDLESSTEKLDKLDKDIAITEKNLAKYEKAGDKAGVNYNSALLDAYNRRKEELSQNIEEDNNVIESKRTIPERQTGIKERQNRINEIDSRIDELVENSNKVDSAVEGGTDVTEEYASLTAERKQLEQEVKDENYKMLDQKYSRLTPDQMNDVIKKASGEEKQTLKEIQWNKKQDINQNIINSDANVRDILNTIPTNTNKLAASADINQAEALGSYGSATWQAEKTLDQAGYDGKALAETYKRQRNAENYDTKVQNAQEFATNHPVWASAMSVGQNMVKAGGTVNMLGRDAANLLGAEYKPVDYKDDSFTVGAMSEAERGQVSAEIEKTPVGKTGSFAYNVGMSMADSLAQRYAFGPASTVILGTNAASDAARTAAERGLDDKHVAATAIAAGTAEWLFETVELESLKQFQQEAVTGFNTVIKNAGKQAANEGVGEGLTDIANAFTDWIINQDANEFNTSIENYMSQGMTFNEARKQASMEWASQFTQDVLAGALSGGISAGIEMGKTSFIQGNKLNNSESTESLIQSGLESAKNTESYKQAVALQNKLNNGGKANAIELSNLANANSNAIAQETSNAINKSMENVTNGAEYANILNNAVEEGTISTSEAKSVLQSAEARSVLSELSGVELSDNSTVADVKNAVKQTQGATVENNELDNLLAAAEKDIAVTGQKAVGSNIETSKGPAQLKSAMVRNGNAFVEVKLADGSTEAISVNNYNGSGDANIDTLVSNISRFDDNGARGYISGYDGTLTAEDYTKGFEAYYEAGKLGMPKNTVNSIYGDMLPIGTREIAYQNGINDNQEALDQSLKNVKIKGENKTSLTKTENTKLTENEEKFLSSFAENGTDIIMFDSKKGDKNANGFYANGKIYINNDTDRPVEVVQMHEYTHNLKDVAPKEYRAYRDALLTFLKNNHNDVLEDRKAELRSSYESQGVSLSNEDMLDELTANSSEFILHNIDQFSESLSENKSFLKKLIDFVNNFIEYIKDKFEGTKYYDQIAELVSEDEAAVKELSKLYAEAVNAAQGKEANRGPVKYSFSLKTDNQGNELSEEQQKYFKDSKLRDENGRLRVVYHGTNSDRFNVFDWKETGSLDGGFFGRGFYFAFSESEAKYYGTKNVFKVYLDLKNPFIFNEEMYSYNPDSDDAITDQLSFLVSFNDKFPDLAKQYKFSKAVYNQETGENDVTELSISDIKKGIEKLYKSDNLKVNEISGYDSETGKDGTWYQIGAFDKEATDRIRQYYDDEYISKYGEPKEYRHDSRHYYSKEEANKNMLNAAMRLYIDMNNIYMGYRTSAYYIEDIGDEFSKALMKKGYDGVIQSMDGDEAVAFYPEQIKETTNKTPTESDDIRYSLKNDSKEYKKEISSLNYNGGIVEQNGFVLAENDNNLVKFNLKSEEWVKTVRDDYLSDQLRRGNLDNKTVKAIKDEMDLITQIANEYEGRYANYSNWQKAEVRMVHGVPVFSVEVPNGEYKMNIDFSTVCKKRKALNAVLNAIVQSGKFDLLDLNEVGIAKAQDIIKKHDLEVACRLCFVDAKRYRIKAWADSFTEMWNAMAEGVANSEFNFRKDETVKNKNVVSGELTRDQINKIRETATRFKSGKGGDKPIAQEMAELIIKNPEARHTLNSADLISSQGMGELKATFPELHKIVNKHQGTAKPKTAYDETPYNNEIINIGRYTAESAYAVGGVRIQSFSDYMGNMFFDYAQMIAEMAAKKLPAHSYTKELDYIRIFGKTGVKINMSLVPAVDKISSELREFIETELTNRKGNLKNKPSKRALNNPLYQEFLDLKERAGLDKNGNYLWADETFRGTDPANKHKDSLELADEWQNKEGYKENVGTIAVGVSDAHIYKLLADDRIRMVIPYHKSSINHVVAAMGNIDLYNDYTNYQNTRQANGKKLDKNMADFDWYGYLNEKNSKGKFIHTAKDAAKAYLDFCKENNYLPKFDQFKNDDNYYKLLIDFCAYDSDGNYHPQMPVTMTFPEESLLRSYIEDSLNEYETTLNKQNKALQPIIDELEQEIGIKYSLKQNDDEIDMNTAPDYQANIETVLQTLVDSKIKFEPTETQLNTLAKMFVSKINSDYDTKLFKDTVKKVSSALNERQTVAARDAMKVLQGMSMKILETSKELDYGMRDQYKDVLDYLKKTNIVLTENQKQEAAYRFGSYNEFRRKYFGKINLRKEGITPDVVVAELADMHPELFSADMTEGDAPFVLSDVVDLLNTPNSTKLSSLVGYGTLRDQSYQMAAEMMSKLMTTMNVNDANMKQQVNAIKYQYDKQLSEEKKKLEDKYFGKMKEIYNEINGDILDPDMALKLVNHYAAYQRNTKENAAKKREAATRSKYKKDARKIADGLYKALTNPTESRYIPAELANGVIDFCKEINFDTGFRKPGGQPTKAYEKLMEMRKSYESLRRDDPDTGMTTLMAKMDDGSLKDTGATYDATISQLIDQVAEMFKGDKKINDLTTGELEDLVKGLSYIDESIRNATKLKGKWKNKQSYIAANNIIEDIKKATGSKNFVMNKYTNSVLSPKRFFRRLVGYRDSSDMMKLYDDLQKGEVNEHRYQQEAQDLLNPVMEGKTNEKMLKKLTGSKADWVDIGLKDSSGKPVFITPAMKISLYMHAQNASNVEHAANGGIKIPDQKLYKAGKITEAYNRGTIVKIPENFMKNLKSQMSAYELDFARCAKDFFDDYSKKLVNKTSYELLGYEKARVKNYFPIRTDSNFNRGAFDSVAFDFSIQNSGFLKNRTQHAKNPMMLEDVTSVLKRQIDSVSKYAALAIPLDNFQKIYNVTLMDYENSIKNQISKTWDQSSMEYISKLMGDLNGSRKSDKSLVSDALAGFRGLMAQGVLTGNLSVTMKQAASYPTAAATLGWGPLAKAFSKGVTISKAKAELINKYTPEWRYRGAGNSTIELGDLAAQNSLMTRAGKVPVLGAFLNSIQNADLWTTAKLWDASEFYVQKNFNYEKGSDSYYRKTAEIYNKVLHDTQPNYSVLNRPEILRTKSEAAKALTMFMTQRLQNGNILMDSTLNLKAKQQAYKADKTDANMKALAEAKTEFSRSVTSQIVAAMTIGAMTLLAKAAYHKMDRYRDDDDELTKESIMSRFVQDTLSSLAGSFLFGSEIYDFVSSKITGDKYYGISDNLFGNLEDAIDAVSDFYDNCKKQIASEELKPEDLISATAECASTIAQAVGIPASNVTAITEGIILHLQDVQNGEFGQFESGFNRKNTNKAQRLYEGFMNGDNDDIEKFYNDLVKAGKTEGQIETEIKKLLVEQNEDVAAGAQAKFDGDARKYAGYVKDLINLGFERDTVVKAMNKYIDDNLEDQEEKEDTTQESYTLDEILAQSSTGRIYSKEMLYEAARNADESLIEDIVDDAIDSTMKKDGLSYEEAKEKVNKSLKEGVKGYFATDLYEMYSNGETKEADQLKKNLMDVYGYEEKSFKDWLPDGMKDDFADAFIAGDYNKTKEMAPIMRKFGYNDETFDKLAKDALKEKYVEAYNAGNTTETKNLQQKAEDIGVKYATVLGWVGKKTYTDSVENIEAAIKTYSGGPGSFDTYLAKAVEARDAEIERIMKETGNDEWDARTKYKGSLTEYFKPLYKDMSVEDRNRLQTMLKNYFWYGKSRKKNTPYKFNDWLNPSESKNDDEEEKSKIKWY